MTATVVIANSKGGPGKTTVAWNLVNHWVAAGRRVLVVDTDPQGTLISWFAARDDKENMQGEVISLPELERSIKRRAAREEFDFIVVDTPGRLSELAGAIRAADVIVCPVQPTDADYHAFKRTFQAIEKERAQDRVFMLPNRVKTPSQLEEIRATLPAVAKSRGRIAKRALGDWVKLQQETLAGLSVIDMAHEYDKERLALTAIAGEIEEMLNERRKAA